MFSTLLHNIVYIRLKYIENAIRHTYTVLKESVDGNYNQFVVLLGIICPCITILLMVLYILMYQPFLNKLKASIWITQGMISLIPTKLFTTNKKLGKLIFTI